MKRKISLALILLGMLVAVTVEKEDSIVPQMAGICMMLAGVYLQDENHYNGKNCNSDTSEDESHTKSK